MSEIPSPPSPSPPLSEADERLWAMLAHLSVLLNLVTGFLGVFAPLGIYLVLKDRSRYVAFQSMQAFLFQLLWWVGGGVLAGVLWTMTGVLAPFLIGLLCAPFALLASIFPLIAIVYGIVGAIQSYQGQDFHYWLVADWVNV